MLIPANKSPLAFKRWADCHCVKSVDIRSYSDPHSDRIRENADQNNSDYGHFIRSVCHGNLLQKNNSHIISTR